MRAIDGDRLLRELTTLSHGQVWPGWTYEGIRLLIERQPTLTPPPITGDTSDGYHTFNELYHHRAVLFSVICNARPDIAWKSKKHHDGTMYDGMFIVGIDTPEGQATYHYDIKPYWRMFRVKELEFAPKWDGHTPDEAIRRIGTLTPPNEPFTVTEVCPNCESEITMAWSIIDNGYKAFCPICGNRLMLCDECQHGEPSFACDYNGATDTCRHNPPDRRPPEGEVNA